MLWWLGHDGVRRFHRRVAQLLLANAVGMGLQLAAFGLVFAYAHALERDRQWTWMGRAWVPRESPELLIAVALIAAICLVVAAGLVYRARTEIIHVRRRYEEFCRHRALLLASRLPFPSADLANRILAENGLPTIAYRQARLCGRALMIVLRGTFPAGRAVIAFAALFLIHWRWSLVVVLLLPVAAYVLYGVNVAAARASWRQERKARPAALAKRRLIGLIHRQTFTRTEADTLLRETHEQGSAGEAMDAFYARFLIRERAQWVANLFVAGALLVLLVIAGQTVFGGHMTWAIFLAYLFALRVFLLSSRNLVTTVVQISRMYPYLRSYADFVDDARRADRRMPAPECSRTVVIASPPLNQPEAQAAQLTLMPGQRVWWLTSRPVDRALAAQLQICLRPGDGAVSAQSFFFGPDQPGTVGGTSGGACVMPGDEVLKKNWAKGVLVGVSTELPAAIADNEPVLLLDSELPDGCGWAPAAWFRQHPDRWQPLVHAQCSASNAEGRMPDDEDDDDM